MRPERSFSLYRAVPGCDKPWRPLTPRIVPKIVPNGGLPSPWRNLLALGCDANRIGRRARPCESRCCAYAHPNAHLPVCESGPPKGALLIEPEVAAPAAEVLTVDEAASVLRISRNSAYALAREWEASGGRSGLPVIRLGRNLRVPRPGLLRLLHGQVVPHEPSPSS